jgi:hypothetical protein
MHLNMQNHSWHASSWINAFAAKYQVGLHNGIAALEKSNFSM